MVERFYRYPKLCIVFLQLCISIVNSLVLVDETFCIVRFTDIGLTECTRIGFFKYTWFTVTLFNHNKVWLGLHISTMCIIIFCLRLIWLKCVVVLANIKFGDVEIEDISSVICRFHVILVKLKSYNISEIYVIIDLVRIDQDLYRTYFYRLEEIEIGCPLSRPFE
jgi:hypothetical protein